MRSAPTRYRPRAAGPPPGPEGAPAPGPVVSGTDDGRTLPSVQRDFVEWRRGRRHYAVWALDVDLPGVRAASEAGRAALSPWLLPAQGRQPHVTIRVCGFPALQVHEPDDFGFDELAAQTAALARARIVPFHIEIGAPDSFASAAYLGVGDPEGGIAALRRTLGEVSDADVKAHPPHVTFALYRGAFALPEVHRRLRRWTLPPLRLAIDRVHCMHYDAAVIDGPLTSFYSFNLGERRGAEALSEAHGVFAANGPQHLP